ncbi:MAG TPA: 2-phospho-L-lactate guanylyltransferase [Acidimicrobiia bacterium]|nr:2-phospho-L-lactate guanylyltransferase [Acidimicrobiia bacterium]
MASHSEAAAVVIPVRSFAGAKARLAPTLDEAEREALARAMADAVITAARSHPIVVVTSAPEVHAWATAHDAHVIDDPGSLDAAAAAGRAWASARGLARYVVAHADLPFASSFEEIAGDGAAPVAVIVADHRGDGTPVLSLPTAAPFAFAYGPGSAARHAEEAARCGLEIRIVNDSRLGLDIDLPEDLAHLERFTTR